MMLGHIIVTLVIYVVWRSAQAVADVEIRGSDTWHIVLSDSQRFELKESHHRIAGYLFMMSLVRNMNLNTKRQTNGY